ncbi:MAG: ABC transporter substrate-binding protein [Armatimonadota bacterium]
MRSISEPRWTSTMHSALAVILCLFVIITGIAAAPSSDQVRYGGTFVFGTGFEPGHLNPVIRVFNVDPTMSTIYSALLRQNLDLSMRPDLAESWTVSKDGLTYTFRLARNVTWHDGKPFSADDVRFTFTQVLPKTSTEWQTITQSLRAIETPDPNTVILRLKRPFAPLLVNLEATISPILPRHLYEGTDLLTNPYNIRPVGTGPFKFDEWARGSHVRLVRNENYFKRGLPYLDRLITRFVPDPTARLLALESGEIDAISGYIPFSEYARFERKPGFKFTLAGTERLASIATSVCFNLRHATLSNIKVRQALAHAIDKQFIIERAAFGVGRQASGHISSGIKWAYNPNVPTYPYDPRKANQLLDEAGFPRGPDGTRFKVRLVWNLGDAEHTKSAEILAQQFRAVGVDLTMQPMEAGAWSSTTFINWDFDITLRGIGTGPDPSLSAMWRSYYSGNIVKRPLHNNMGYKNTRVDELFARALFEPDQKKRADYFYEMQVIMMRDLPSIPIRERAQAFIWRDEFAGELPAGPAEGVRNSVEYVWWRKGKPSR